MVWYDDIRNVKVEAATKNEKIKSHSANENIWEVSYG